MNPTIALTPEQLAEVEAILREHLPASARVWVFGSRARGIDRRSADLDLAVDLGRRMTLDEDNELAFAFEDSDLPFRVDVVDWQTIGDGFRRAIERDLVPLIS